MVVSGIANAGWRHLVVVGTVGGIVVGQVAINVSDGIEDVSLVHLVLQCIDPECGQLQLEMTIGSFGPLTKIGGVMPKGVVHLIQREHEADQYNRAGNRVGTELINLLAYGIELAGVVDLPWAFWSVLA